MGYTFTVGTDDPRQISAASDDDAIHQAIDYVRQHHAADLGTLPNRAVTLMGPLGLLTRPSERLDEFVERETGVNPATDPDMLQPGDFNTPDCNGD